MTTEHDDLPATVAQVRARTLVGVVQADHVIAFLRAKQ